MEKRAPLGIKNFQTVFVF